MQRNNAKGWKNNNIEFFDNKVEPYVNTYSVYAIDLSDKDMREVLRKKKYINGVNNKMPVFRENGKAGIM